MKLRRKIFVAVSSLAVLSAALLTGCGAPASDNTSLPQTGILTLSVNPEIRIEYDKEGKVLAMAGENDDGKSIVSNCKEYVGMDCDDVLKDLICLLYTSVIHLSIQAVENVKSKVIELVTEINR